MFDRHQVRLAQMLELMVRTLNPRQKSAFRFQLLDNLPAIHGGYNNHQTGQVNPRNTTPFSSICRKASKIIVSDPIYPNSQPSDQIRHIVTGKGVEIGAVWRSRKPSTNRREPSNPTPHKACRVTG